MKNDHSLTNVHLPEEIAFSPRFKCGVSVSLIDTTPQ